jgi:hypothetical protein
MAIFARRFLRQMEELLPESKGTYSIFFSLHHPG